jgi:hypothetical protein
MPTPILRAGGSLALAAGLAAAGPAAVARPLEYALDLPADRMLSYEVEFEVAHPGPFRLDADWSPSRVLVLRLERPGKPVLRRSGPPPHRIEFEVAEDEIERDVPWLLQISGLPSRESARGRMVIRLPDPPGMSPPPPATEPDPPAREPDPRTLPVTPPARAGADLRRVFDAVERFRKRVVEGTDPDAYRWQYGMLGYLAACRDRGEPPPAATRAMLRRVADAVAELDGLRRSGGGPLLGAEPTDPVRRRAWLAVRDPRFSPVEQELGALLDELHRGLAPELRDEVWFSSFLSCLIVCERHFEERARLGAERASNGDLVALQWAPVLAAAEALGALADLR